MAGWQGGRVCALSAGLWAGREAGRRRDAGQGRRTIHPPTHPPQDLQIFLVRHRQVGGCCHPLVNALDDLIVTLQYESPRAAAPKGRCMGACSRGRVGSACGALQHPQHTNHSAAQHSSHSTGSTAYQPQQPQHKRHLVRMSSSTAQAPHSTAHQPQQAQHKRHLVRMSSSTEPPSAATTLLRSRLGRATCRRGNNCFCGHGAGHRQDGAVQCRRGRSWPPPHPIPLHSTPPARPPTSTRLYDVVALCMGEEASVQHGPRLPAQQLHPAVQTAEQTESRALGAAQHNTSAVTPVCTPQRQQRQRRQQRLTIRASCCQRREGLRLLLLLLLLLHWRSLQAYKLACSGNTPCAC